MPKQFRCTLNGSERSIPLQAVIFDMDGSLVETTQADYLAWKKVFLQHDRVLSFQEYFPLLGMKSEQVVRQQLGLDGDDVQTALAQKLLFFEEIAQDMGINTVAGVEYLLTQITQLGIPMALATSSRRRKMKQVLEVTGLLTYFHILVSGEEVSNSKPSPDIFYAAAMLDIEPAHCLVFEDAASGVKGSKAAGMACIAITTTHPDYLLQEADLIIEEYKQISFRSDIEATNV